MNESEFAWLAEGTSVDQRVLMIASRDVSSAVKSCLGLRIFLCVALAAVVQAAELPVVEVASDNTVIARSCQVVIPPGTVIQDADDNGVIHVEAPDIEIVFPEGSVLRGSAMDTRPDEYRGYGVRLEGHRGVTIRGLQASGFWCGLWASKADGLTVEGLDGSDNRRAYLRSTPLAEDGADWLFGHNNDNMEWLTRYAAAVYIDQSKGVTVRSSRVRHGQNALCLDRVSNSKIYDNDFSFNSGWGIALWRCTGNVISRNAIDFCVRGYSHGVYNRGQDSAGIFAFEQNNNNVFAENSVTHGGDGFFGFAGAKLWAMWASIRSPGSKRRGNTDNLLIGNDFSYAPAHGIENTFSFGNKYVNNRIVDNAICGVWAGYSRETLIAGNEFIGNGEMGYGLERGGVNIDHGGDNTIVHNQFRGNKCGVHLWGGANPNFDKKGWAKANGYASTGSVIADNTFTNDEVAFHFRGPGQVKIGANQLENVTREMIAEPEYEVHRDGSFHVRAPAISHYEVYGQTRPVGARPELRGRENIIMTQWGPWDHESPLIRRTESTGSKAVYEVHKAPSPQVTVEIEGDHVDCQLMPLPGTLDGWRITAYATTPGAYAYRLRVLSGGKPLGEVAGALLVAKWDVTFFAWPVDVDPREKLDGYQQLAEGPGAVRAQVDQLQFKYGMGGPSDLGISEQVTQARLGAEHFGMVARTRIPLTKGTWELTTLSDDGVRVSVDGKRVIDNWTWHVPNRDTGRLTIEADKTIEIVVEHFEIDGFAVLEFSLTPVDQR